MISGLMAKIYDGVLLLAGNLAPLYRYELCLNANRFACHINTLEEFDQ